MNKFIASQMFIYLCDKWQVLLQKNIVSGVIDHKTYKIYSMGLTGDVPEDIIPFSTFEIEWDNILQKIYNHIKEYVQRDTSNAIVQEIHKNYDGLAYNAYKLSIENEIANKKEKELNRIRAAEAFKQRNFGDDLPT